MNRADLPALLQERAVTWGGAVGKRWLDGLPNLVTRLTQEWGLKFDTPLSSHVSFVASVTRSDGSAAVLKVPIRGVDFPFAQANASVHEPDALRAWAGNGSIQLLELDPESGSLLLEACQPGTQLAESVDLATADEIAIGLLPRLWQRIPARHGLSTLDDLAVSWSERIRNNYEAAAAPVESGLIRHALSLLEELRASPPGPVLLHGDFHHNNVLAARREPWLVIDPLPLVGEPAYDAVMFLLFRKGSMPHPERSWNKSVREFSHALGLEATRVKAWIFVRLINDALTSLGQGSSVDELEQYQEDLWSARLIQRHL